MWEIDVKGEEGGWKEFDVDVVQLCCDEHRMGAAIDQTQPPKRRWQIKFWTLILSLRTNDKQPASTRLACCHAHAYVRVWKCFVSWGPAVLAVVALIGAGELDGVPVSTKSAGLGERIGGVLSACMLLASGAADTVGDERDATCVKRLSGLRTLEDSWGEPGARGWKMADDWAAGRVNGAQVKVERIGWPTLPLPLPLPLLVRRGLPMAAAGLTRGLSKRGLLNADDGSWRYGDGDTRDGGCSVLEAIADAMDDRRSDSQDVTNEPPDDGMRWPSVDEADSVW
jgi:hypothetical protein